MKKETIFNYICNMKAKLLLLFMLISLFGYSQTTVKGVKSVRFIGDTIVSYKTDTVVIDSTLKVNSGLSIGNEYSFPTVDGSVNQVLTTDGSGGVTWENSGGGGGSSVDSSDMVICRIQNDTVYKFYGLTALDDALTYAKVKSNNVYKIECYADTLEVTQNIAIDTMIIDGGTSYIYKTNAGALCDLDADDINLFRFIGSSNINSKYGVIEWDEAGNLNTSLEFKCNDITSSDGSLIYFNIGNNAYTSNLEFDIQYNRGTCSYASQYAVYINTIGSATSKIEGNLKYNVTYSTGHGGLYMANGYQGNFNIKILQNRTESTSATQYALYYYQGLSYTTSYINVIIIDGEFIGKKTAYIFANGQYSSKGFMAYSKFHNKSYSGVSTGYGYVYLHNAQDKANLFIEEANTCVVEIDGDFDINIGNLRNCTLSALATFSGVCNVINPIYCDDAGTTLRYYSSQQYAMIYTATGSTGIINVNGLYKSATTVQNGRALYLLGSKVIISNFFRDAVGNVSATEFQNYIKTGSHLVLNNVQATYTQASGAGYSMFYLDGGTLERHGGYFTHSGNLTGNNIINVISSSTEIAEGGFMDVTNASSYSYDISDGATLTQYIAGSTFTNSTINTNATGVLTEPILGGGTIVPSITLP